MISEGLAFLDGSGTLRAADESFRALVGLPPCGAAAALGARSSVEPRLGEFLSGRGPSTLRLEGAGGAPGCELLRLACDEGVFVRARGLSPDGWARDEHAIQALALARLASGIAHEARNSLNAMALQVALLGEKVAAAGEAVAAACTANLASMHGQIGRINDLVRRFVEVADPVPARSFDAGMLLASAASLFGPEARRRRIALSWEAPAAAVRAEGPPCRAARLVLGMLWEAVSGTPEGGQLAARASSSSAGAALVVEHSRGPAEALRSWIGEVIAGAAAELGGRLDRSTEGDIERVALVLPRERAP